MSNLDDLAAASTSSPATCRRPKKTSGINPVLVVAGVVGVLLIIVLGVVVVIRAFSGDSSTVVNEDRTTNEEKMVIAQGMVRKQFDSSATLKWTKCDPDKVVKFEKGHWTVLLAPVRTDFPTPIGSLWCVTMNRDSSGKWVAETVENVEPGINSEVSRSSYK